MDPDLMKALNEAWERVRPKLESDPGELGARLARRRKGVLQRPHRAWCLAVRANDTRMTAMDFPMAPDHPVVWDEQGQRMHYREHEVTLEKRALSWLCRPVGIPAPGVESTKAAQMLGVTAQTIMAAVKRGIFSVHYVRGLGGKHGPPVPLVHTRELLDPAGIPLGAMAEVEWGTQWRYLADQIPADLCQTLQRVPIIGVCPAHTRRRSGPSKTPPAVGFEFPHNPKPPRLRPPRKHYSYYHKKPDTAPEPVFMGWRWVCPGCQRQVRRIFYPLPALFQADFVRWGNEESPDAVASPPACFACEFCHNIQHRGFATSAGWGTLVTWASGGLLYGREVKKPEWFKLRRKKEYVPLLNRAPSKAQPRVLPLLLHTSLDDKQIARTLKMPLGSVRSATASIYRRHQVHKREELREAVAREAGQQENRAAG